MDAVPRAVAKLVDARDHYACIRCGQHLSITAGSRHHRQRRAIGGHTVANLILLCGSGTTGCHGWVHSHPESSRAAGWIVRATGYILPEETPLQVLDQGVYIWVILNSQGKATRIPEETAYALIGPNR
jgi:hypothetical protein